MARPANGSGCAGDKRSVGQSRAALETMIYDAWRSGSRGLSDPDQRRTGSQAFGDGAAGSRALYRAASLAALAPAMNIRRALYPFAEACLSSIRQGPSAQARRVTIMLSRQSPCCHW